MPFDRAQRVLIYVQHLLGVGHLQRALQLGAALAREGFGVDLVSGGNPAQLPQPAGVRLHQLAPVHSTDGSFSRLLDARGETIGDACKSARRQQLLEIFEQVAPRVLITETFPFGRRMMAFELLPLLERAQAARSCALIAASVRDIPQPKSRPGRNREIIARIEHYYDRVLVHGDASIAAFEIGFADAAAIAPKLFYSGYICAEDNSDDDGEDGVDEVLVSAGGSDTGLEILETALAAKPLTRLAAHRWRLLVSPAIGESAFSDLRRRAGDGVCVERNRVDFGSLMRRARLSVSQAGYNTVTDILRANIAAVVVPYAEAGELEQTLRARAFAARGRLAVVASRELCRESLARAIDDALELDTSLAVDLDGARRSARQLSRWLREQTA